MNFQNDYKDIQLKIEKALKAYISHDNLPQRDVYKAMEYSLMAGGKRIRPCLAIAVSKMFEYDIEEVLPFACAIEMIHTYSLIHDDLPAMDNDDYRRGKLTNHKVFGEAMAILAGDALLNLAFEIMFDALCFTAKIKNENKIMAAKEIASAAGVGGMIGGQVLDLASENTQISKESLEIVHSLKTGRMIIAPVKSAAIICNASKFELEQLVLYAQKLGLAFQIKDDILDVEGDQEKMGKKIKSDEANSKSTFVTVYGLDESKKILNKLTKEAIGHLDIFEGKSWFLRELANELLKREN